MCITSGCGSGLGVFPASISLYIYTCLGEVGIEGLLSLYINSLLVLVLDGGFTPCLSLSMSLLPHKLSFGVVVIGAVYSSLWIMFEDKYTDIHDDVGLFRGLTTTYECSSGWGGLLHIHLKCVQGVVVAEEGFTSYKSELHSRG